MIDEQIPTHEDMLAGLQKAHDRIAKQQKRLPWAIAIAVLFIPIDILGAFSNFTAHSPWVYSDILMALSLLANITAMWLMFRQNIRILRQIETAKAGVRAIQEWEREKQSAAGKDEMRSFYDFSEGTRGKYCRNRVQ